MGTMTRPIAGLSAFALGAAGLADLWQMHFSQLIGHEYTVPGMFIANLLDARADGSFTVTNQRNGFCKRYAARPTSTNPTRQ